MSQTGFGVGQAVVIGASGQDGYFLTESLLAEGWKVHAVVRRPEALMPLASVQKTSDRLERAAHHE